MDLQNAEVVVVKIGTSTLTYESGKLNLRRIDQLCRCLLYTSDAADEL